MLLKRVFLAPADATTPSTQNESNPAPSPAQSESNTAPNPAPSPAPATSQAQSPEAPSQAPSQSESKPASSQTADDLKAQVEALHSELQVWKLKSSMSERRIVPQDSDLVSRLVLEMVSSSGKSIDQCVSDLYSSKPYLFKIPKEDTKRVENKSPEVDNKRLIDGAIARLGRAKITL